MGASASAPSTESIARLPVSKLLNSASRLKLIASCRGLKKQKKEGYTIPSKESSEARALFLKQTMKMIVSDEHQLRIFERFLETEYCVAWIMCWRVVLLFEQSVATAFAANNSIHASSEACSSLLKEAYDIYSTFLSPEGDWFIGVSAEIAEGIRIAILEERLCGPALFHPVKAEVLDYLAKTKVQRFVDWLESSEQDAHQSNDTFFVSDIYDSYLQNSSAFFVQAEGGSTNSASTYCEVNKSPAMVDYIRRSLNLSITSDADILADLEQNLDSIHDILLRTQEANKMSSDEGHYAKWKQRISLKRGCC